jgi:hypothetical protein
MKSERVHIGIALALIAAAVGLRLLPHPANFAPVAAVAIFGGAVLPVRAAVGVPLAAMMLSDAVIGFYDIMPVTWACYALIALASSLWLHGGRVRPRRALIRGVSVTLGASVFFFVVTNFAVWVASGMYAHTWAGLAQCYYMALPFFRNTLLSDVVYTGSLFGLFTVVQLAMRKRLKLSIQSA